MDNCACDVNIKNTKAKLVTILTIPCNFTICLQFERITIYICTMFKFLLKIGVVGLLFASAGCSTNESNVPNVAVNLRLLVSNPDFINLNAVGGYVNLTGGSRGIIVYRYSVDEFRAFDRHCPFNADQGCRVTVNSTDIEAEDIDCCNSKFLILDGSVIEGPANQQLKPYTTSFDGNTLLIYN